ncbi:MAG: helix-turn-helix domain-containing protein [Acidobacteriaceae bacterium]|nr:helix-turn-helix domain-containing protein [Acidobacteriaceae bacterium]
MAVSRVLQSWKQIAEYVGRTERTVQRWEQAFGFPVRRPSGKQRNSVMALTQEIEEWTRGKPSLIQLRESARLNRAELVPRAENRLSYSFHEQLQTRVLIDQQRALRNDVRNLLQQQRTLRQTLMQNLPKLR